MKTRDIKTAGVLLLSILMVTVVNAQRPNQGGRGMGPCGAGDGPAYGLRQNSDSNGQYAKMNRMAALDLTEEQQAEMTTLRTQHYKAITPLKNKMVELKARERTLLSEANVDMKAVNKTIDNQTELTNSIRKLQVEQQVAIKGLLTDEQVMKMQQRRQFARRDNYRGNGGQRGDRMGRGNRGYKGI